MTQRMSETIMEARAAIVRGLVVSVDDSGPMQTVTVQTANGMTRSGIEVWQFAGLATAPVVAGSAVLLFAVGGDPGDMIALPPITPATRFGALAPGETTLYNSADGSRISFRSGGVCELRAYTSIWVDSDAVTVQAAGAVNVVAGTGATIQAPNVSVAASAIQLGGSTTVTGDLSVAGTISDSLRSLAADRALYDAHTHTITGVGVTGTPEPQM